MDWTTGLEAIRLAIAAAANLPDRTSSADGRVVKAVVWENEARAARWVKDGWVDLEIDGMRSLGQDETRKVLEGDDLISVVTGNRHFHVTCKCGSDDQTPGRTAQMLAERIRSRIRLPSIQTIYRAGGAALDRVNFSYFHDYRDADSRRVSEALLDLSFMLAVSDRDDGPTASKDWIEEVSGEGELEGGVSGDVTVPWDSDEGAPP